MKNYVCKTLFLLTILFGDFLFTKNTFLPYLNKFFTKDTEFGKILLDFPDKFRISDSGEISDELLLSSDMPEVCLAVDVLSVDLSAGGVMTQFMANADISVVSQNAVLKGWAKGLVDIFVDTLNGKNLGVSLYQRSIHQDI